MLFAVAMAFAGDASAGWKALYEARLVEIVDGTPDNAVRLYQALLEDGSSANPLQGTAYYWMGRARLAGGDVFGARAALELAVGDPSLRAAALALIEEADLRVGPVLSLPARFSFEGADFPGVRGWTGAGRGAVGEQVFGQRTVFSWATTIRPGEPDRMSLRFGEGVRLAAVNFAARSTVSPAVLKLLAIDEWGDAWSSTEIVVDDHDWYDVSLRIADFRPVDGTRGAARIGRVVELRLEDVTGERSDERGTHTILIDDLVAS